MLHIGILWYTNVIEEDLERFNEWWFRGKVGKELALPFTAWTLV